MQCTYRLCGPDIINHGQGKSVVFDRIQSLTLVVLCQRSNGPPGRLLVISSSYLSQYQSYEDLALRQVHQQHYHNIRKKAKLNKDRIRTKQNHYQK